MKKRAQPRIEEVRLSCQWNSNMFECIRPPSQFQKAKQIFSAGTVRFRRNYKNYQELQLGEVSFSRTRLYVPARQASAGPEWGLQKGFEVSTIATTKFLTHT